MAAKLKRKRRINARKHKFAMCAKRCRGSKQCMSACLKKK